MKPFRRRLEGLLRRPATWLLMVLLTLAGTIWFLGPSITIDGKALWANVGSRILTIALLLLPWLSWRVFVYQKQKRAQSGESRPNTEIINTRVALEQRYQLHQQRLADRGIGRRQQNRQPWFLLLGSAGSGKSSLLASAQLPEHCTTSTAPPSEYGSSPLEWHGLGQCSWLETSGDCLPEADQTLTTPGWVALLDLLRQRRAPAISALVLLLPVDLLTEPNHLELDQLARRFRRALNDLRQTLGLDIPVYLLLSKADLVPGITELYHQLPPAQRQQPFGVGLPNAAETKAESPDALAPLLAQLNRQILCRTQLEPDTIRRGRLYDLPYQLARLEGPLRGFLANAFRGNTYQQGSRLLGIYLTVAGNQHDIALTATLNSVRTPAAFIDQLLGSTIAERADSVTLTDEHRKRQRTSRRLTVATATTCIALFTLAWALRYDREAEQLQQLAQLGQHFTRDAVRVHAHTRIEPLLQQLDARYAATLIPQQSDAGQVLQYLGLEQSAMTLPVVEQTYAEGLQAFLLPLVARQLEYRLRTDLDDRQQLLGHLRAYLMLALPERLDPAYLNDWMRNEWERRYPAQPDVRASLHAHFERLLAEPLPPSTLNQPLIAETRTLLLHEPLAQLCYRLLLEQSRSLPAYRLDTQLGRHHQLLAARPVEIPGFYSKAGYERLLEAKGPGLIRELLADDWVLGSGRSAHDQAGHTVLAELEAIYFQDYAEHWTRALASLQLQKVAGYEARNDLAALSSADSPLLALLGQIRLHTRLVDDTDAAPSPDKQALQQHFSHLHRLLDDAAKPQPALAMALESIGALQLQLAQLDDASTRDLLAFRMAGARMQRHHDAISAARNSATQLPAPLQLWVIQLADQSWQSVLRASAEYVNGRYRHEVYRPYKDALADYYPFNPESARDVELDDFGRFFQREGTLQRFTSQYLEPFLISTGAGYRLRLLDGRALPLSTQLLSQLNRASTIHSSFFAADPFSPSIGFRLEPYSLDASLGRSSFDYGNQQLEYRHGPIVPVAFSWPATLNESRITLTLEDLSGRRMSLQQSQGTWSLFRLLDQLTIEQPAQRDAIQLRASIGGMRAQYLLHSQRAPNPFEPGLLASFKLPARL